jgi:catechol 2,3-dioxygenase
MPEVNLGPRRLGHVNMFVVDLEKSITFYSDVAGIELVRREPGIRGGFHSNGNTHHDIGLIEVTQGEVIGRDGYKQPSSWRGKRPGLNHLGWEMDSESTLVSALHRAEQRGVEVTAYADHLITHSAYLRDPDDNWHEFYADIVEDWREIFNLDRDDLVSGKWEWNKQPPDENAYYPKHSERRLVAGAPFGTLRISHARLVARDYPAVLEFFRHIGGMELVASGEGIAFLRNKSSDLDLILVSDKYDLEPGLHSVSFLVDNDTDLIGAKKMLTERGVSAALLATDRKQGLIMSDPDGVQVELYRRASPGFEMLVPSAADRNWPFRE